MHPSHIPQCTSLVYLCVLWDICLMHCGICEMGLLMSGGGGWLVGWRLVGCWLVVDWLVCGGLVVVGWFAGWLVGWLVGMVGMMAVLGDLHRGFNDLTWTWLLKGRETVIFCFQMQRLVDPIRYMSFRDLSWEVIHEVGEITWYMIFQRSFAWSICLLFCCWYACLSYRHGSFCDCVTGIWLGFNCHSSSKVTLNGKGKIDL